MDRRKDVIQTHPLVGWDISTVDSYDAMMIRLHSLSSQDWPDLLADNGCGMAFYLDPRSRYRQDRISRATRTTPQ